VRQVGREAPYPRHLGSLPPQEASDAAPMLIVGGVSAQKPPRMGPGAPHPAPPGSLAETRRGIVHRLLKSLVPARAHAEAYHRGSHAVVADAAEHRVGDGALGSARGDDLRGAHQAAAPEGPKEHTTGPGETRSEAARAPAAAVTARPQPTEKAPDLGAAALLPVEERKGAATEQHAAKPPRRMVVEVPRQPQWESLTGFGLIKPARSFEVSPEEAARFVDSVGGVDRLHTLLGSLWPIEAELSKVAKAERKYEDDDDVPDLVEEHWDPADDPALEPTNSTRETGSKRQSVAQSDLHEHGDGSPTLHGSSGGRRDSKKSRRGTAPAEHSISGPPLTEGGKSLVSPSREASAESLKALNREMVSWYWNFEHSVHRSASDEREMTFGMFSAEVMKEKERHAEFWQWLDSSSAARFMHKDLHMRPGAIKGIRSLVYSVMTTGKP